MVQRESGIVVLQRRFSCPERSYTYRDEVEGRVFVSKSLLQGKTRKIELGAGCGEGGDFCRLWTRIATIEVRNDKNQAVIFFGGVPLTFNGQ